MIRRQTGTTGIYATKLRQVGPSVAEVNVEATITTQLGRWNISFDRDIGDDPGYRTAVPHDLDIDEQLTSRTSEVNATIGRWLVINGEGSRDMAGGQLALNGRIARNNWRGDTHDNKQPGF